MALMAGQMGGADDYDMFAELFDFNEDEVDEWEVTMVMYLDEDYQMISSELNAELQLEIEGMTTTMVMVMRSTVVQIGNVVIDFPDWVENFEVAEPVDAADLVGVWEWDLGGYVYVFNADGTGFSGFLPDDFDEFTWEIVGNVLYLDFGFTVDSDEITIDGDVMTVFGFTYYRTDESVLEVEEPEPEVVDEPTEEEDDEDDEDQTSNLHSIIGEWNWDLTNTWYYTFNADGTGMMYPDEEFTWTANNGVLTITMWGLPLRWEYEISGNRLHISSLDAPGIEWTYIRQ